MDDAPESASTIDFDPAPDHKLAEDGAHPGWLVVHQGDPRNGDHVLIAKAIAMSDGEGHGFIEVTEEFTESTTITDDQID